MTAVSAVTSLAALTALAWAVFVEAAADLLDVGHA
jgi:hypothetical protein